MNITWVYSSTFAARDDHWGLVKPNDDHKLYQSEQTVAGSSARLSLLFINERDSLN